MKNLPYRFFPLAGMRIGEAGSPGPVDDRSLEDIRQRALAAVPQLGFAATADEIEYQSCDEQPPRALTDPYFEEDALMVEGHDSLVPGPTAREAVGSMLRIVQRLGSSIDERAANEQLTQHQWSALMFL